MAIIIFCKIVTSKMLASKVNASTTQKSKASLWTQLPAIQKYAAFIELEKEANGLSSRSVALKLELSWIASVSFVETFVAFPLNDELLISIFGSLSKINLINEVEKKIRHNKIK